ncbi:hypothetical protein C1886_24500 [Pseudomonas sp. FW300-N1A1]|nr:hypothetical protein [Pseudomonas sp. FW300-N1A1]POA16943.1 hypothetical protein C1886_24500 [Pseudomonas sp. FW300-N1A1]
MPRQSDLRFTFELLQGDAFEVVEFELEEALSQPFKLTLDLASHDPAIDFNRVHEHARVRALIGQAVREQTRLGALLAPYTDRAWQRVVSDLTYSGAAR